VCEVIAVDLLYSLIFNEHIVSGFRHFSARWIAYFCNTFLCIDVKALQTVDKCQHLSFPGWHSITYFTRKLNLNIACFCSAWIVAVIRLVSSSGKRNVTIWRPSVCTSVCMSRWHTHRNSPRSSMWRGQRRLSALCDSIVRSAVYK